jgi:hypothetical protein
LGPHGHAEHQGRLDIVIYFHPHAIIVIEIKKGDADKSDTGKHAGYNQWLGSQPYAKDRRYSIFLAASAEEHEYEYFPYLGWDDLCIAMRRLAIEVKRERLVTAAMILAFVAAVEQNLLGFSGEVVRAVAERKAWSFNPRVVDHIARFVNKGIL